MRIPSRTNTYAAIGCPTPITRVAHAKRVGDGRILRENPVSEETDHGCNNAGDNPVHQTHTHQAILELTHFRTPGFSRQIAFPKFLAQQRLRRYCKGIQSEEQRLNTLIPS